MKQFIGELFQYNELMNQQLITVIADNEFKVDERIQALISHILLVHRVWLNRILQQPVDNDMWQLHAPGILQIMNVTEHRRTVQLIHDSDLEQEITYTNSKGKAFHNTVADILFHIINHSNYHRGQVNARLRQVGIEPVITDYIVYRRQ